MKKFGAHISAAGGLENAPARAAEIGADAFAIFSKNQRRYQAKPIGKERAKRFKSELKRCGYAPEDVLVHDSYLINMGSPDPGIRERSIASFIDEAKRLEAAGLKLLNFHPGSHLGKISEQRCLELIADGVNLAAQETEGIVFVIENTAGQGTNLGFRFEHLRDLIGMTEDKSRIGVCLDTCHTYSAGYDIASSRKALDEVMREFDRTVGLEYLRGAHLNDSKTPFGSRKDRHENLGKGSLGLGCFEWIAKDKRFEDMPLILETPNRELYAEEIKLLKNFCTE